MKYFTLFCLSAAVVLLAFATPSEAGTCSISFNLCPHPLKKCISWSGFPKGYQCVKNCDEFPEMPNAKECHGTGPKVWDTWQTGETTWVVQDLPEYDDEEALDVLFEHLCPDETMCIIGGICNDPISIKSMRDIWRDVLKQRTSLACYELAGDTRTLAGLNVCYVKRADAKKDIEYEGDAVKFIMDSMDFLEKRKNVFQFVGDDKYLAAMGLVVKREFRGNRLGERILNAREPMCRSMGIRGTSTVFTGIAAQKSAAKCGFTTLLTITHAEMADEGFKYPRSDREIKVMAKKYY